MPSDERSPLLPTAQSGARSPLASSSPPTASSLSRNGPLNTSAGLILTEDDITIEGMVLALLAELTARGYTLPPGLPTLPSDMPLDEAEAESAFLRTVFSLKRHKDVLDAWVPDLSRVGGGEGALSGSILATNRPLTPSASGFATPTASSSTSTLPARPSPLSQSLDPTVLTSPSALFLASLLSLLISLQAEYRGTVQETDRGVDGELRMFKARRELGERLYAVVVALLDSYLLSGDARDEASDDGVEDEREDALVTLLFRDFPLNYDSMDRATCSLDLLLTLSSFPLVEAEDLVSHPVVLASTEYVWRNGILPPPRRGALTLGWKDAFVRLDRFSTPRILHTQTFILSTLHDFITIYILMFSSYSHFDSFNPLSPTSYSSTSPLRPNRTFSLPSFLFWWLWVAGVLGWAGEVSRAWFRRGGPQSSLPLSPSTLLPLLHHALVFVSLLVRSLAFYLSTPRHHPTFLLSTSLSLLAWSVPFLAASRVLPQNLPSFGTPTHQQWYKLRDGRKRRDVGYRPPPKRVPVSHRALRSLEANLGGLVQFLTYFVVFGLLLLWSLSGEIDYPGYFLSLLHLPLAVFPSLSPPSSSSFNPTTSQLPFSATPTPPSTLFTTKPQSSPIEARTTLAFTLVLGVVLAYFSGGRPSVAPKPPPSSSTFPPSPHSHLNPNSNATVKPPRRELDDLDGWTERYGREVAFRARRERLAVTRYFTFVPGGVGSGSSSLEAEGGGEKDERRLETLASAFSTPPLPSPLNLAVPPLELASWVAKRITRYRASQRLRLQTAFQNGEGGGGEDTGEEWTFPPGQEGERVARRVQEVGRLWVWRVGISPLGGWAVAAKGWRMVRGKE
ncbi:hypothetical protein JCM8547_006410 [Rhodosporidiobolus lusitaniae]